MGDAVAIKVPHEVGWLADEQATRTEQHVLMAVRHEHLVGLRDVVAMPDDRTALVFDLVTGASLRGMVRSRGHLRPGEVVTVVTPLCEAVAALHAAGGLHGDISPSNVMVTAAGKPLLLDLGAARLAGSPADAPVFGTPGFVAPEVRQGLRADGGERRLLPRSAGVVLPHRQRRSRTRCCVSTPRSSAATSVPTSPRWSAPASTRIPRAARRRRGWLGSSSRRPRRSRSRWSSTPTRLRR